MFRRTKNTEKRDAYLEWFLSGLFLAENTIAIPHQRYPKAKSCIVPN